MTMSEPTHAQSVPKVPWWQTVLAVLFLLALGAAIVAGGVAAVRFLAGVEGEIAGAIITALSAVVVGTIGVVGTQFYSARAQRMAHRREKLVPIYEEFVAGWMSAMGLDKTQEQRKRGSREREAAAVDLVASFSKQVLVWGSPDVLQKWIYWRQNSTTLDPRETLLAMEQVMFAMRRDLGMKDSGLSEGDLLRLFINDWDSYVEDTRE